MKFSVFLTQLLSLTIQLKVSLKSVETMAMSINNNNRVHASSNNDIFIEIEIDYDNYSNEIEEIGFTKEKQSLTCKCKNEGVCFYDRTSGKEACKCIAMFKGVKCIKLDSLYIENELGGDNSISSEKCATILDNVIEEESDERRTTWRDLYNNLLEFDNYLENTRCVLYQIYNSNNLSTFKNILDKNNCEARNQEQIFRIIHSLFNCDITRVSRFSSYYEQDNQITNISGNGSNKCQTTFRYQSKDGRRHFRSWIDKLATDIQSNIASLSRNSLKTNKNWSPVANKCKRALRLNQSQNQRNKTPNWYNIARYLNDDIFKKLDQLIFL